jgi:hypothetical protein
MGGTGGGRRRQRPELPERIVVAQWLDFFCGHAVRGSAMAAAYELAPRIRRMRRGRVTFPALRVLEAATATGDERLELLIARAVALTYCRGRWGRSRRRSSTWCRARTHLPSFQVERARARPCRRGAAQPLAACPTIRDHRARMTWYPDLSHGCMAGSRDDVRAIGWLSGDHAFPTGPVPPAALEALRAHLQTPWMPFWFGGTHQCDVAAE